MLEEYNRLEAKDFQTGDTLLKKSFDDIFNSICEVLGQLEGRIEKEKIHELGELTIELGGDRIHRIMLINSHPEVNIEDYAQEIQRVFARTAEIHPVIVERIKYIVFSSEGKEFYGAEADEKAIQEGKVYAPNAERLAEASDIILLKDRAFKNISPRYQRDNPDIKSAKKVSHFEMIIAHELFHKLGNLSKYQTEVSASNSDPGKNFYWMQRANNIRSLDFNGFVSSSRRLLYLDGERNLKEEYRDKADTIEIKNGEGRSIECIFFPQDGVLVPREDIVFPERIITNYAREQLRIQTEEEFCDSMVVYAFDPEFLKEFDEKRKTKKFDLLEERWGLYTGTHQTPDLKLDVYKK